MSGAFETPGSSWRDGPRAPETERPDVGVTDGGVGTEGSHASTRVRGRRSRVQSAGARPRLGGSPAGCGMYPGADNALLPPQEPFAVTQKHTEE